MEFYKKFFFATLTIIVAAIIVIKFTLAFFENKIIEVIKSDRFHNFMSERIKYELQKHATKNLDNEEIEFYTKEINKVIIKWKPVIDNLNIK
jgi:hypothetical protein